MTIFGDYFELPSSFPMLETNSIWYLAFVFVAFLLCRISQAKYRPYALLVLNTIFLFSFSKYAFFVIFGFAISSYVFGILLKNFKNKFLLIISIIPFVCLLSFYKYGYLIFSSNIVMPLGISFYTFKIISYLVDIYLEKIDGVTNIIYYLDYVMSFPCVTAGPINRVKPFIECISNPVEFDYKKTKGGAVQLFLGIFEKMVFSENIALAVTKILDNSNVVGMNVLFGIILYSFQIYLDFDAYSNIAIGTAKVLGFDIPKNFNSPYLAVNLKDFWRRWHISLSTWFRDYVYIPLGGNKFGKKRRNINLIIVFILSGIWHGSTFNFILWGLLNAIIQIIENKVENILQINKLNKILLYPVNVIRIIINFLIVSFLWLIFRYQNMNEVIAVILRLFTVYSFDVNMVGLTVNELYLIILVIIITCCLDVLRNRFDMIKTFNKFRFPIRWLIYIVLIVSYLVFAVYGSEFASSDFIYKWF